MSILQSLRTRLISVYKTIVMLTPSGKLYELELEKMLGCNPHRENSPLTRNLYKLFSISEDGITLELLRRMHWTNKAFLEFRVRPLLSIQENSAIISPNVSWTIEYNPSHKWRKDNYMGV